VGKKNVALKKSELAFRTHHNNQLLKKQFLVLCFSSLRRTPPLDFFRSSPRLNAEAAPKMAPRKGRGRGRGNRASAKRGGQHSAHACSSRPHNPESLVASLHLRAPQHAYELPTPENANPPSDTPVSPRELAEQVTREGEEQLMAPVRDPNNVDGTRPLARFAGDMLRE
jgi:hypothetical protein